MLPLCCAFAVALSYFAGELLLCGAVGDAALVRRFVAAVGAVVDAVAALGRRQARGRVVGAHDVADLKQKLEITAWSKQTQS